jgi:hypothetical protein
MYCSYCLKAVVAAVPCCTCSQVSCGIFTLGVIIGHQLFLLSQSCCGCYSMQYLLTGKLWAVLQQQLLATNSSYCLKAAVAAIPCCIFSQVSCGSCIAATIIGHQQLLLSQSCCGCHSLQFLLTGKLRQLYSSAAIMAISGSYCLKAVVAAIPSCTCSHVRCFTCATAATVGCQLFLFIPGSTCSQVQ